MEFYATLSPGLEDVAVEEIKSFGAKVAEAKQGKGRVFFSGKPELIPLLNRYSRTLERLNILLLRDHAESLEDIYRSVKSLSFDFLKGKSFAVRSLRVGVHEFTSLDIARVSGQAVIDSFLETHRERLRVNLDDPDVIVRVELIDEDLFVGIDTTGDDAMHKRWWRVYNHPAHLNATIACAMIRLSKWKPEESLLDPMCGSGTIPIEAVLMAKNVPNRRNFAYQRFLELPEIEHETKDLKLRVYGIEKFRKHLEGAVENAKNAGVADAIEFSIGDATKLEGKYDVVVTNPPYGLRIHRKGAIEKLYREFAISAKKVMSKDSRLVVITSEYEVFRRVAEEAGFSLVHERFVKYGGLLTKIMIFTS
ncbi:MAG: tRNA (guanine(6)-N2)-methyltransferase [Archaeoglobaceae archaeon]